MRTIPAAVILALVVATRASAVPESDSERPNLVLIMADDVGYECFSIYGSKQYATPHIDRLAREGVRFSRCFAQPLCTPSRVKIMTGRYNLRNYRRFGLLDPKETTFAQLLRKAGYRTAIGGKWQLGGKPDRVRELGFDAHCLWHLDGRPSRYWEPGLVVDGKKVSKDIADRFGPDVVSDYLIEFIRKHRDEPFFVYYPMMLVHWPFVPTPDSSPGGSRERKGSYDGRKGGEEYFDDMVGYMDKLVGRMVKELDTLGIRNDTLVMFTGDNGTATNIVSELHGRRIRGGKGFMTDAGTHVPLVCSWPARVPKGRVSDALVDFSDFLPTLLEAGKAPRPDGLGLDGMSFLPVLLGADGPSRKWVFTHYNPRPEQVTEKNAAKRIEMKTLGRFVRDAEYKLYQDGRLYSMRDDVEEKRPIASGKSEVADAARARLERVLASFPE